MRGPPHPDPADVPGSAGPPGGTASAVVFPPPVPSLRISSFPARPGPGRGAGPRCGDCRRHSRSRGASQKRVPEGRPSSAAEEYGCGGRLGPEGHQRGVLVTEERGGATRRAPCGAGPGPCPHPTSSEPRRGEVRRGGVGPAGRVGRSFGGEGGRAAVARGGGGRSARALSGICGCEARPGAR